MHQQNYAIIKTFVSLKAERGNVTVVLNRNDYDDQIFKMLHDQSTHQPLKCRKTVNTFVSRLKQKRLREEFKTK